LINMIPRNDLCSTTYCLAHPGSEYLMYLPEGGPISASLGSNSDRFMIEWFDTTNGVSIEGGTVDGGHQELHAPFNGSAVVHVKTIQRSQRPSVCEGPKA